MGPTTKVPHATGHKPRTSSAFRRVTGVFEQVVPAPEPAALPLLLTALGLFTILAGRTRRS